MKGLRQAGCDVYPFNLDDRIAFYSGLEYEGKQLPEEHAAQLAARGIHHACYEWWPDVVIVVSAFFVPPATFDLWKHRPHKIVLLFTESPYEDDRQLELVKRADPALVIVNDPTNLDQFREVCPNSHYIGHAYDPDIHRPGLPVARYEADFTFVGTGYPSRILFFEQVDWTGLDVTFAGHWKGLPEQSPLREFVVHPFDECFDNVDAVDLYRSAKASANLYRAARRKDLEANRPDLADGWSVGPREIELAACGTFFLRESRGEGDRMFPMLPVFSEPDEFADKLRWWLAHDVARSGAAAAARAVVADRTFDRNARTLLSLIPQ